MPVAEGGRLAADEGQLPMVSVIVPVRDMTSDLVELVELLERQTLPRDSFEVVIGDDGSTDGILDSLRPDGARVRVAGGQLENSYAARNRAVTLSRGGIIACCDADCRPEPTWLARGIEALASVDIVGGAIRFMTPERASIWSLLDVDTFLDQERAIRSGYAVTANLFFRRELFNRLGGFDASLPNQGDYDFVKRCIASGATITFAPEAIVWHPTRNNQRAYIGKVWNVNLRYAQREATAGRLPDGLKLRSWVPVVQTVRGRRRVGRPVFLNGARLQESRLSPTIRDQLVALPLLYLVLPYIRNVAQLVGWIRARRVRVGG